MTHSDSIKGIAAKLALIMGEVAYVQKTGTNTKQNYKYVKEADVAAKASEAFSKHGVAIIPDFVSRTDSSIKSQGGSEGGYCSVLMTYTLIDGESGEWVQFQMPGDGTDYPGDKAIYKAVTGSYKYALLKLVMVSSGDDPETESPDKKDDNLDTKLTKIKTERGLGVAAVPARPAVGSANQPRAGMPLGGAETVVAPPAPIPDDLPSPSGLVTGEPYEGTLMTRPTKKGSWSHVTFEVDGEGLYTFKFWGDMDAPVVEGVVRARFYVSHKPYKGTPDWKIESLTWFPSEPVGTDAQEVYVEDPAI